jgi:hypothetical protein
MAGKPRAVPEDVSDSWLRNGEAVILLDGLKGSLLREGQNPRLVGRTVGGSP